MNGKKPWEEEYHVDAPGDVCLGHTAVAVVLDPESDPELRATRAKMFAKSSEMVQLLLTTGQKHGESVWHTHECWARSDSSLCILQCTHTRRLLADLGVLS